MGANQATVTLNVKTMLNSIVQSTFLDKYDEESVKKFERYPLTTGRNMYVRGDLIFRIVGKNGETFADFSGLIVPAGAVSNPNASHISHLLFDESESIYDVVEFVGVFKDSRVHADGGVLMNENNANTPGHQIGAVFSRGTDTIAADSSKRINQKDLLIWVAPRYKAASQLSPEHRFLARVEPLGRKHITDLWRDSQFAFMDEILRRQMSVGALTGGRSRSVKMIGGGSDGKSSLSALAATEFKRDLLNAMAVIHVLTTVGKVKVSNTKTKKQDAMLKWVLENPSNVTAQKIKKLKLLIDAEDAQAFGPEEWTCNGDTFATMRGNGVNFYGVSTDVYSESLSSVCGLMTNIELFDKDTGLLKQSFTSDLMKDLASVLVAIPIDATAERFRMPGPKTISMYAKGNTNAKIVAENFYSSMKSTKSDSYVAAFEQYRKLNKRIIGESISSSPGNPDGIEFSVGSMYAPQIDVDILSQSNLFH